VPSPRGPVPVDALKLVPASYAGLQLLSGDPRRVRAQFESGAVLVSEPLAWRLQLRAGGALELQTAAGMRAFPIAGVYREYGNDRGNVLMSRAEYERWWHDDAITALGVYLARGAVPSEVIKNLRAATRGKQALLIRSNAELRAISMEIFERTFVITRVLYWLAAVVAAVGLVSALLAWELERAHELALTRALGLTRRGAGLLVLGQTAFMGLCALLAAIPAGVLTALVLTEVINRRAFGWHIDLHLNGLQFSNALLLSVAAALAAGAYPAWRLARAPIAAAIREE
jgi:putative ABC transport system permease protein